MRRLLFILVCMLCISSISAGDSFSKIVNAYRKLPDAQYVDLLKSEGYAASRYNCSPEQPQVLKKVKSMKSIAVMMDFDQYKALAARVQDIKNVVCLESKRENPEAQTPGIIGGGAILFPGIDVFTLIKKDYYSEALIMIYSNPGMLTMVYVTGKLSASDAMFFSPEISIEETIK